MEYTADSWFFVQLKQEKEKAIRIWDEITGGKSRLIIPATVLVEIIKRYLKKGKNKALEKLITGIELSNKINVVDLDFNLARKAGQLGFTYNIPPFDSAVLATAIETEFTNVLTDDSHFIPADKHGKIKMVRF